MFPYLKTTFQKRWKLYLTIGVILSCLGLAYMGTQTITDRIQIQATSGLEKDWRYQYDILVLPKLKEEAKGLEDGWVAPQSSVASYGGIPLKDWEIIKDMEGVEVAAPIALMGYFEYFGMNAYASNAVPGNWHLISKEISAFDGLNTHVLTDYNFIEEYYDQKMEDSVIYQKRLEERGYPINGPPGTSVRYPNEMMLVAIDPETEEQLYNVSESVISGNYLDVPYTPEGNTMPVVPVIALQNPEYDMEETVTIQEIEVPDEIADGEIEGGTGRYLRSLPAEEIASLSISTLEDDLRFKPADIEFNDNEYIVKKRSLINASTEIIKFSPITYDLIDNTEGNIPLLEAESYPNTSDFYDNITVPFYRYETGVRNTYDFTVDIVGFYDSSQIKPKYAGSWMEGDPIDVYTPHHSMIIKNGLGEEVDPTPLLPLPVKASYYPGAPDMLTSINSLRQVYGEEPPLSSIRVVVNDVAVRSPESQAKIEDIATQITEETGHRVEIMLGSSASKVHVNLAGNKADEIGTVEEGWQQKGVSWSIENHINQTNILLFIYLFVISIIFCFTVITHSLLNRAIDFAMLRSIGWTRGKIIRTLLIEVFVISSIPVIVIIIANNWLVSVSTMNYLYIWLITFVIISFGYVTGSRKALNLSPRKGLEGEGTEWKLLRFVGIRSITSYVIHQLLRRPLRFGLLTIVIAITTFMLLLSIATQQSLSDFLYLSFIGEAIDLKLSNYQITLLIASFALAIAITFLLLFLNITERKNEFTIFRLIGWPMKRIQFYINLESLIVSIIGAVLGTVGAIIFIKTFLEILVPVWMIVLALLVPILLIGLFTIIIVGGFKVKTVMKNHHAA